MDQESAVIRIGPAGWSYADWQGRVYPHPAPRGFDPLEYLAHYFDTIEINSSFYRPPTAELARRWVMRVAHNPRFTFTAKLSQKFTHERTPTSDDEDVFKRGIEPLVEAGKLGALLVQFPWSFRNTPSARQYVEELVRRFAAYPLVVEVRHASWNVESAYDFFRERGVGFCNIDQPVVGRSLGPTRRATAPVGYVRLHGRNYENWFSPRAPAAARYDYLYSREELRPWSDTIRALARTVAEVYVITNNHYQGKGVVNALELKADIEGRAVPVPEPLIKAYPRLESLAAPTALFP
jgi:uncharacterized protein YecE (DUF72 family)